MLQLKKHVTYQIYKEIRHSIAVVTQLKTSLGPSRKTTLGNLSRDQHRHIPAQTQGREVQARLGEAGGQPLAWVIPVPPQLSTAQLTVAGNLGTSAHPGGDAGQAGCLSKTISTPTTQ